MDFDPDSYLASDSHSDFDPDSYLTSNAPPYRTPLQKSADEFLENSGEMGAGEAALHAVTGGIGTLAGGLSAAGTSIYNAVAPFFGGKPQDPAANMRQVQSDLTYEPRSKVGKETVATLGAPMAAVQSGADKAAEVVNRVPVVGPALATAVDLAPTVIPLVAGGVGSRALGDTAGPYSARPTPRVTAQDIVDRTVADSPQSMGAAASAPNVRAASPELQAAIIQGARKTGGAINPEAAARQIEADSLPVRMQLTEGQALQDPEKISQEMNGRGKTEFVKRYNEQNTQLIQNLQAIREQAGPDVFTTNPVEHGDTLIQAYKDHDAPIVADIEAKYKALEDANGGQFPLDTQAFVGSTDAALRKALKTNSLPADLAASLNEFRNGRQMTFEDFESLRSDAADAMRTATDGRQRAAAGIVRQQLENLPLTPQAARLKPLADAARAAAKARFDALDADPAYDAAVHGTVPPDRFVQKFVTGPQATRDGVATMKANLSDNPTATQTMTVAALDQLRAAAGVDEQWRGNFGQAGFNKQLQALGPKLSSLMDPKTAQTLESVGNVARHTQFQPRGSYVNNSNTLVGALAEHGATAAENLVNAKTGIGGTVIRKGVELITHKQRVQKALAPGAGITTLPEKP